MGALLDLVPKGSTDRAVTLRIIDAADGTPETGVAFNTSGIDLWYRREGAAKTSITEATLSALTDAHADGGFLHIGDGEYRLDVPDAAFATGAQHVDVGGTVTGMIVIGGRVRLVDVNLEGLVAVDVTNWKGAVAPAMTGDAYARLGAPAGASTAADIAAVKTDTGAISAKTTNLPPDPADASDVAGAFTVVNGKLDTIDDFLDTEIAAIKTKTDALPASPAAVSDIPTAAAVSDAVWQEPLADHSGTAGSTAAALAAAGSAGDPWATALPGAYTSGQAGQILGTNLNATVGSRATQASMDLVGGIVEDVLEQTGTTGVVVAAGSKTGYALSAAGVQAIWDALAAALTTTGSIGKRIVDFLTGDAYGRLGAPAGASHAADVAAVKADTAAIKLKTDGLPATPAAAGDIPSAAAIADAVFEEPMAGHTTFGTYGDQLRLNLTASQLVRVAAGSTADAIVLHATTGVDEAAPSASDDVYNGRALVFLSGVLVKQATAITDYAGASKTLSVVDLTGAPSAGDLALML